MEGTGKLVIILETYRPSWTWQQKKEALSIKAVSICSAAHLLPGAVSLTIARLIAKCVSIPLWTAAFPTRLPGSLNPLVVCLYLSMQFCILQSNDALGRKEGSSEERDTFKSHVTFLEEKFIVWIYILSLSPCWQLQNLSLQNSCIFICCCGWSLAWRKVGGGILYWRNLCSIS